MFWSSIENYNCLGFSLRHCHKLFCGFIQALLNYNSNNHAFMKKKNAAVDFPNQKPN